MRRFALTRPGYHHGTPKAGTLRQNHIITDENGYVQSFCRKPQKGTDAGMDALWINTEKGNGREKSVRIGTSRADIRYGEEMMYMLSAAVWLLCNSLFLSLHLAENPSSFPKPLSAEEERECLARFAEGDLNARNTLIEHNLRLVAHIVKKYYTQTEEQDDLISIGTIGLIKGISSYKPDKGVRLATYAARCVENAMLT